MLNIEKKIITWCKQHSVVFFVIFTTVLALLVRYVMLNFVSGDYESFLKEWINSLREQGGLSGLRTYTGDYNAPYVTILALLSYIPINSLYTIKIISILFDFALAISCALLVKKIQKRPGNFLPTITYAVVLFLPNVVLNSAAWAQCDSIYTTFVVLSFYFLFNKKYRWSFIMLGVAFAFKFQFIFVLPVYIIIYLQQQKFSILNFLYIPAANLLLCLPALIAGRPIDQILSVYFNQTQTYAGSLVLNFPNIYNVIPADRGSIGMFSIAGIIVAMMICICVAFFIIANKIVLSERQILKLAIWFCVILTFVLPCMHERYLFIGEILSVVYALVYGKDWYLAFCINIIALLTYSAFLLGAKIDMPFLSIVYAMVIFYYSIQTFRDFSSIETGHLARLVTGKNRKH